MAMAMAMAMAMVSILVALGSCIAAMAVEGGSAAGGSDCSAVVYEMMPCVEYISIGSTKAKAPKGCCKAVGDAMKTDPECMCVAFRESGAMRIQLNVTRALSLPGACGISTPLPHCGIAVPPGMAPAPVPNAKAPSPAASRTAPTLPPTMPPTLAPVNPLAPAIPRRRMPPSSAPAPSNGPTAGAAPSNGPTATPLGPDSPAMAPALGQSDASSLTISSSLIVPVLFTLLVLFRPL